MYTLTMVNVYPYKGQCIPIQRSMYTHTKVNVYPYKGQCIPIQRSMYTHTKANVYPYKGHCIPLQRPLYTLTITLKRLMTLPHRADAQKKKSGVKIPATSFDPGRIILQPISFVNFFYLFLIPDNTPNA